MGEDPIQYLENLKGAGIRPGLGPVRRLLNRLGRPQDRYRSVLVGGTNGKGSIAASLASVLQAAGYRVGLYTSPHLVDFGERIRVDGLPIPRGDLERCIGQVRGSTREEVTYFEFATALAFLHFAQCAVDVAVLEVGMGGRLDATHVVRPELVIVSNVAMDHVEFLGPRLTDIAREKAGIIEPYRACVTAARQSPVLAVLEEVCRRRKARLLRVGREIRVRAGRDGLLDCRGPSIAIRGIPLALQGPHQRENAACALGAVGVLRRRGFAIGDEDVRKGFSRVRWEGRLETVRRSPAVVLDGAHNAAGAAALARSLGEFAYRRLTLVLGILADKDWRGMIRRLAPLADRVILTRPPEERALAPEVLAGEARRWNRNVEIAQHPRQAVRASLREAGPDDLICIAGSLYLVGAVRPLLIASKGAGPGGR
ncbi:MAG: bifunctional folylpolyglutamate synthase/dihydrofolate synthase [Syntrophaceae bacterium]|nr:bifunctional folylpolyglutamate synthase/dihydrofolate synthase [Syntrophaceae bacterium]